MGALGIWLAWKYIPLLKGQVKPLDWTGFVLSGAGLALAMFGLAALGRHMVGTWTAVACVAAGVAILAAYVRHARRYRHPLIDLGLLKLPTYRIGVVGGSLFRIGVGAIPFLLPLMLQLGFGLNPLQSGAVTFTSAAGAMFMKTLAARILKRFGFRRVLVFNAVAASLMLCTYGLFRPGAPYLLMVAILLVGGCFRSLQFTSLNAIIYSEVDQARMGQATSLAAMIQQVRHRRRPCAEPGQPGHRAGHRRTDQLHLRLPHHRPDFGQFGLHDEEAGARRRRRDGRARPAWR